MNLPKRLFAQALLVNYRICLLGPIVNVQMSSSRGGDFSPAPDFPTIAADIFGAGHLDFPGRTFIPLKIRTLLAPWFLKAQFGYAAAFNVQPLFPLPLPYLLAKNTDCIDLHGAFEAGSAVASG